MYRDQAENCDSRRGARWLRPSPRKENRRRERKRNHRSRGRRNHRSNPRLSCHRNMGAHCCLELGVGHNLERAGRRPRSQWMHHPMIVHFRQPRWRAKQRAYMSHARLGHILKMPRRSVDAELCIPETRHVTAVRFATGPPFLPTQRQQTHQPCERRIHEREHREKKSYGESNSHRYCKSSLRFHQLLSFFLSVVKVSRSNRIRPGGTIFSASAGSADK